MGERKVLNKYYSPDFDPAKIRRGKKPENRQMTVRMMLPMSIRCKTCGNYIGKGTKLNSRKEDAVGEKYLGIQVFRFYCKCTSCSAEITYKTDPRNSDYVVESGATRNFEPWRGADEEAEAESRAEEFGNPMKSLENRTFDSKRMMDRDAALAEMMSLKKRQASLSVDTLLEARETKRKQREKDEAESRLYSRTPREEMIIHRIDDDDDDDDGEHFFPTSPTSKKRKLDQGLSGNPTDVLINAAKPLRRKITEDGASTSSYGKKITIGSSTVIISAMKKIPTPASDDKKGEGKEVDCGLQLLGAYDDDSEDDD